jgi:uncharacterized membrane protein YqhA
VKFILEKSRYLVLVGVLSLLIAAVAAFVWGTLNTVHTVSLVFGSIDGDSAITVEFIEIVDSFLIATALLIFSVSLYELFIGKLDLPEWMLAHNLYELEVKDTNDLLRTGIAVTLMSAVLIAFGYFGKKD